MPTTKIRNPAVAGQFYSESLQGLRKQLDSLIDKNVTKRDAVACILPHAGYMYSGIVAGQTVSCVNIKEKVILLGPNHTGLGETCSIMTEGLWQTPLGVVAIDTNFANEILRRSRYLKEDDQAHTYEHSLEVELPFLQYFKQDFKIVPIAFLANQLNTLKTIGREIANTVQELGLKESTLIVASTDMTHYEPLPQAKEKDREAIQAILELNEDKLMNTIRKLNISMCGYAPVIVMLVAAKLLGANKANLIKYQTSAQATGDASSVVGYAGITIN